jgi:hypothetical protein
MDDLFGMKHLTVFTKVKKALRARPTLPL